MECNYHKYFEEELVIVLSIHTGLMNLKMTDLTNKGEDTKIAVIDSTLENSIRAVIEMVHQQLMVQMKN